MKWIIGLLVLATLGAAIVLLMRRGEEDSWDVAS